MAFGRSNSLSINTGAGNSLFSQQNNQQSGTLFGNLQTSQAQPAGSLFPSPKQAAQSSNLFSNPSNESKPGLFSSTAQNTAGGLFGGGGGSAQPQAGSLFSSTNLSQKPPLGNSVFGNTTQNSTQAVGNLNFGTSQAQPPASGLFTPASTLQNNGASGSSLFSNSTINPGAQGSGLFGSTGSGPFGTFQQNQQPSNPSIFGLNAVPKEQLSQASMLGVTQLRHAQNAAFTSGLTMGQNTTPVANTTLGAVRINVDEMRPTTRFQDLIDPLKEEFERADKMIQAQEEFCRQIEALKIVHELNIKSIAPDVSLIQDKLESEEQILSADAVAVDANRSSAAKDWNNFDRSQRIIQNLGLPTAYHVSNNVSMAKAGSQHRLGHHASGTDAVDESFDTDMVGNFFYPLAGEMQRMIAAYKTSLSDIESHMKVIESTAFGQAQQLAAKRAGSSGRLQSDDTVKELTDTLRGFEQSILAVASMVGDCREATTELVLGRLSDAGRPSESYAQL